MNLLINSVKIVFGLFFKLLSSLFSENSFIVKFIKFICFGTISKDSGSKFLSKREINKILNGSNKGLLIDGGDKRLSEKTSYTHIVVIAKTGGGKTTSFIYPNIFTLSKQKTSIIVSDPSGEVFSKTSAYMKKQGFEVLVLDPLNINRSIRYNPLANIQTITQVEKVAETLMKSNNPNPSPGEMFWIAGGQTIIEIFIQCLMNVPIAYRNLHNVLYLLQMFGEDGNKLDDFILKYAFYKENPKNRTIYNKWLGFIANDKKMRLNFISEANISLKKLSNPDIAQLMATNNIDFQEIRRKKTILYLCTPSHDLEYYSFILNLFYTQFFNFCMEQPFNSSKDLPIYVLYDEFGHSSIPGFSRIITTIRKYNVSISIILQSLSQLELRYGHIGADAILSGGIASKLFYSGADLHTAQILQNTLGKIKTAYEYKDGKEDIKERNLLNSDEIRTIKEDEAILITGREYPIILKTTPYYKNSNFKYYSKFGECEIKNNIKDTDLKYVAL